MLVYRYTARDPKTGQKIKAEVQADNEQAAAKLISDQGCRRLKLNSKGAGQSGGLGSFRNRIKTKDKILFSRQLSTLINAGLPLVQSLRSVATQTQSKPFQVVINQIISDVEGGRAFSQALGNTPSCI